MTELPDCPKRHGCMPDDGGTVPIEIASFGEEHVDRAAAMVAARYSRERARNALLPSAFEDSSTVTGRMARMAGKVPGVVAMREDEMVGFLQAFLISNRGRRTAYCPDFGHGAAQDGLWDTYRAMYAGLCPRWLECGCFDHAITLYSGERHGLDAWFSLGFGMIVIDALRSLEAPPKIAENVQIRRATSDDLDVIATMELALRRHLSASPVYIPLIVDDGRGDDERWLAQPGHAIWIAFQAGRPVGFVKMQPSEQLVLPTSDDGTIACTGAYTAPDARGAGVGTALLARAIEWAHSWGYVNVSVDFESANIPGAAFWLGSGFRPACYSLRRVVDERLAWANPMRSEEDLMRAYEGVIGVG